MYQTGFVFNGDIPVAKCVVSLCFDFLSVCSIYKTSLKEKAIVPSQRHNMAILLRE